MPSTRPSSAVDAARRAAREHTRVVRECTSCGLYRDRIAPVVGDGPFDARLMVVGIAPRRHEDLQGLALAGGARNVLDEALTHAGIATDEVRVTTVVRCRPLHDRPPTRDEIVSCSGHLFAELDLVRPEVVVALGEVATSVLLGRAVPLERVAGYRLDVRQGVTLVPTYHPAEVVRGVSEAARAIRRDVAVAKAVLDGRMGTGAQALSDLRARLPGTR